MEPISQLLDVGYTYRQLAPIHSHIHSLHNSHACLWLVGGSWSTPQRTHINTGRTCSLLMCWLALRSKPQPSCCEAVVLTTVPLCIPIIIGLYFISFAFSPTPYTAYIEQYSNLVPAILRKKITLTHIIFTNSPISWVKMPMEVKVSNIHRASLLAV